MTKHPPFEWHPDCGGDYTLSGPGYFANYWPDNTVSASIYDLDDLNDPYTKELAGSGLMGGSSLADCQAKAERWIEEHLLLRSSDTMTHNDDTITTPDQLDALPNGAVVLDRHHDAWQKHDDTELRDEDGERLPSAWASTAWDTDRTAVQMIQGTGRYGTRANAAYDLLGPLTVLYGADAPARGSADAETLRAERMTDSELRSYRHQVSRLMDQNDTLGHREELAAEIEGLRPFPLMGRAARTGYRLALRRAAGVVRRSEAGKP